MSEGLKNDVAADTPNTKLRVRDENFRWTEDATRISKKINTALRPIFEECVRGGMTLEGFHYLVCQEANEMMLLEVIDGKQLIEWRDSGPKNDAENI